MLIMALPGLPLAMMVCPPADPYFLPQNMALSVHSKCTSSFLEICQRGYELGGRYQWMTQKDSSVSNPYRGQKEALRARYVDLSIQYFPF
jgi:hypothetical protein